MSNISSLFCSPEQGHRLAELVPKLRSGLAWHVSPSIQKLEPVTSYMTLGNGGNYVPALTLQELRDVALENKIIINNYHFDRVNWLLWHAGAPELADWLIKRLEELK